MGVSKITRNYQVTLPKDIRELRKFEVGDKVLFVAEKGHVEMIKMNENTLKEAAGLWKDLKETGLDYERRVRRGWQKRRYS